MIVLSELYCTYCLLSGANYDFFSDVNRSICDIYSIPVYSPEPFNLNITHMNCFWLIFSSETTCKSWPSCALPCDPWSTTCVMSHGTGLNYVLILFCSSFYTNFLPIFILILFSLVVFNYFIWVDNILFSQVGLIPDCYCTLYWGPGTSQGTTLNPLIHNNLLTLRPAQWRCSWCHFNTTLHLTYTINQV